VIRGQMLLKVPGFNRDEQDEKDLKVKGYGTLIYAGKADVLMFGSCHI